MKAVFTGCPGSGKSTVRDELARLGFITVPEVATVVIERDGPRVLEDKINFRHLVVREQDRLEAAQSNLPRFVWRVHDRGIHDGAGYCMIEGTAVPDFLRQPRPGRYDVVFLFEPVPHGMDMNGVRQLFPGETDEYRRELNATLRRAYEDNGYPVVTVPFAPVPERVDFVRQTMEVVHSRSGLSTVRMTLPQAADLAYAHN